MKLQKKILQNLQIGLQHHRAGRLDEARRAYLAVLKLEPKEPDANRLLGAIHLQQKDYAAAAPRLHTALASAPRNPDNHYFLGRLFLELGRHREALAPLRECLRLAPREVNALITLAVVQCALHDLHAALRTLDTALAIAPRSLDALINRIDVLMRLDRFDEAWNTINTAITVDPSSPPLIVKRAYFYLRSRDFERALRDVSMALQVAPDRIDAQGLHALLNVETNGWEAGAAIDRYVSIHGRTPAPLQLFPDLTFIAWKTEGRDVLARMRAQAPQAEAPLAAPATIAERDRRLRIGYLSSDLRSHAVGQLIGGTLAAHDRDAFDIVDFSVLADDPDDRPRQFIQSRCSEVHFLHNLEGRAVAEAIHAARVDVLVELNGWTAHTRLSELRFRPAPIQINYLGYPGTSGASYMDYIIGDASVTPPQCEAEFSEKVIRLPVCYMPFDSLVQPEPEQPPRAECGLPDDAVVFCGFNSSYKLTDDLAACWTRILTRVPGSVLWLLAPNSDLPERNIRAYFAARGIAPERIVFAPRTKPLTRGPDGGPSTERSTTEAKTFAFHLGRHKQATVFLDAFYYNAHTTGLDALWAGLPIVTRTGLSFAGRVTTSFLRALDMPELITSSSEDYENLAVDLAQAPARVAALKQRLAATHRTSPLFDATQTARHLEMAYRLAWQRHCDGLPPAAFDVPRIA
jgi:predicted O-linked N-acetylglucosamine transferase (SPINDLY family)